MDITIVFGVAMFTGMVLLLVAIILMARSYLVSSGDVSILINGEKTITVPAGGKLLQTLSEANCFFPPLAAAVVPVPNVNVLFLMVADLCCPPKRVISASERRRRDGGSAVRLR